MSQSDNHLHGASAHPVLSGELKHSQVILLKNARLLDPQNQQDRGIQPELWLRDGRLQENAPLSLDQEPCDVIDATGMWLMPALVDLCGRLREPGQQQHGTLKSEGKAARANGILHVVLPPDTRPVQESGALLAGLRKKALEDGGIHLHTLGALTKGLAGEQPANLAGLKQGGCIGVSNARGAFASDDVMLRTLEYAASLGLTVFFYPEEADLAKDGCVHDGFIASRQGLTGIPRLAESVALAKQLLMVEQTGIRAHFGLLSCRSSVEQIRLAKAKGLPVTADVAMHQLFLTDQEIDGFNSLAHVRPPLRSEQDRQQLRQGVAEGIIDAICSHHEPLSKTAKLAPFADTEAGISAFDTYVALGCQLVAEGVLTPLTLSACLSTRPAAIAGIESFRESTAGWVLLDPTQRWTVGDDSMVSLGKNTPFRHQELMGKVHRVFD